MEQLRRRQNRSCDQCRASKRRCVQIDDFLGGNQRCRTCSRLGRRCTFDFVKHHRIPKQRQTFVVSDTDPLASPFASAPLFDNWSTQGAIDLMDIMEMEIPDGVDATLASSVIARPFYDTSTFNITNCITLPNDPDDSRWELTNTVSSEVDSVVAQDAFDMDSRLPLASFGASLGSTLAAGQAVRTRAMHNSPLGLLNSTIHLRLESEYLTLIFHSLTIALYVRYVSPLNVFPNESPYEISFEQSEHHLLHTPHDLGPKSLEDACGSQSSSSASQCEIDTSLDTACIEPSKLQSDAAKISAIDLRVHKVTMIGVALFLDHFGPIYGTCRSKLEKQEDQATLSATVRAFVLANAPIACSATDQGDDTDTVFENAWLDAYHHLTKSMARRSFTLAYTAFTFDLLPIPLTLSSNSQFSEGKQRLLRHSVQQLEGLLSRVGSFCAHMPKHSKYRSMLEACKQTMKWHGYLRDTLSAFTNGGRCVMADTLRRPDGDTEHYLCPITDDALLMQEDTLHRRCQQMSSRLFVFYRDIVQIRTCLNEAQMGCMTSSKHEHEAVSRVMASLDSMCESWVQRSLDQFAQLSPALQLSFGFLIVYWNLGVFKVYEIFQSKTNWAVTPLSDIWRSAYECRSKAVTLHAKIMKAITDDADDAGLPVLEGTNFKLPFMAHHANTTLLTLALTTAIEHTIDMALVGDFEADGDWLKPSLCCLLSLENSTSGRSSVRPALDRLIQRYGDIILECWSGEDELV